MATGAPVKLEATIGRLTGVHIESIDMPGDFIDLAARFAHLPGTVVLLSGGKLDCARYHIMGALPWLTLSATAHDTALHVDDQTIDTGAAPFDLLRRLMARLALPRGQYPAPLAAGLLGYLAYDLKDQLERLPRTCVDDTGLPQMLLYAHRLLVVHDKKEDATRLMVALREGGGGDAREDAPYWVGRFHALAAKPPVSSAGFTADSEGMASNFTQPAYESAVHRVIDYIAAGDVYQVNISQRFQVPFSGDSFGLFAHLYQRNPAPFFAFVQAGDHQIVSTSPERFIQLDGRRVETRPIKGTRPRGATEAQDQAMRQELENSAKDDAELSMIVDLLRNDIGKVCAAATVHVAEHKRLEAYENVYHLVSIVKGELDTGKDSVDLIEATFPGGSITGCPKVRAMEIIDALESHRRHVYCGSIGYLGLNDTMDLSIAIRTATVVNGMLRFSVGGGIVFDSDPRLEYEETLHKGRTLMAACAGRHKAKPASQVWFNGHIRPAASAKIPVSDQGVQYGYGFFETLRVDNGEAPLLAAHIARFERTWRALMPQAVPDLTWKVIIDQVIAANDLTGGCAAVKLLATRGSRSAPPWDAGLLVTARPYTHRLAALNISGLHIGTYPHTRQSPLAEHKTLNYLYYLRAGRWAQKQGFHEAIILNPDGTVSETNTANLLLIEEKTVVRPQSSAVLPGVMAEAVCGQLADWGYEIVERPVKPDDLVHAQRVMATNALMGAVPVDGMDGQSRPSNADLAEALNDALIPGWRR